jgi:PHP family Zn ribbon phosphoesterase
VHPDDEARIQDIRRLVLHPDDVIVLKVQPRITTKDADAMRARIKTELGEHVKVLILAGVDLAVITPEVAEALEGSSI